MEKLLEDFPQDRDDKIEPSTQTVTVNVEEENDEIFTQRPISTQKKESEVNGKGSKLFEKYVEFALKRAELETAREVHFLVERGVEKTPFVIEGARDLTPVFRKDFMLPIS